VNKDIRVEIGFFTHRKTRKLIIKFGLDAAWGLLQLWAFAAKSRCNGYLTGMSDLDIAMEMHVDTTKVDPKLLVEYMKSDDCRWIDTTNDGPYLHDWHVHNPWAAGSDDRSDTARFNRMAQTFPKIHKELTKTGVTAITREDYYRLTKPQRTVNNQPAPAPSPAPSPAPAIEPVEQGTRRKREPFRIPSVEEVQAYCTERKNDVNAQKFIDHYTNTGWRVGKPPGYPMKDWKAAVRNTWESNNGGGYGKGQRNNRQGETCGAGIKPAPGEYEGRAPIMVIGDN
jgi:hypothetical protein